MQWGFSMVKRIPNVHRKSIYFFRWPAMDSRQQQPSYYRLHFFVEIGWAPNPLNKLYGYRKPSIKPPGGSNTFEGGGPT